MDELVELAEKAFRLEAMRKSINEASWDARCALEAAMVREFGMDGWLDAGFTSDDGTVEPTATQSGFKVVDWDKFERWAVSNNMAHCEWVIDDDVLDKLDRLGSSATYKGKAVQGVIALDAIPNGIHLSPSSSTYKSVKEVLSGCL